MVKFLLIDNGYAFWQSPFILFIKETDMELFEFLLKSVLLGIGLAMDAFSVSLANGLHEPKMRFPRMALIAGTFAFFQFLMPMIGWECVHTV